ncbi:PrsW family glutamic-type intramembrane protease [Anaerolinea thermophila]|uniref:Hypothetical membrane protein n=1 Tax=Anaerolinea thermophila (strain DSM 14523 / JCM 11388 / NBRC 100420 / UNI-1) TaxID=926569 RepID=E8N2W4_ANATU|nr:PrsW family glutamic-type intramembrane protease [Anaerolinea thermophila]BAJ65114.1 hypothetical membrane protein [Anaerolinea thermophila UNI-1]
MNDSQPAFPIRVAFQLLLSLLGLGSAWLIGLLLLGMGALGYFSGSALFHTSAEPLLALGWAFLLLGLVALPSLWAAGLRLWGKEPAPLRLNLVSASLALLLVPLIIVVGAGVLQADGVLRLFMPFFQIAVVVIPALWLVAYLTRPAQPVRAGRFWGAMNVGVFFVTPLILLVEGMLMVLMLIGVIAFLSSRPEMMQYLADLSSRLLHAAGDPEMILRIYRPILRQPLVLFGIAAIFTVFVPLIEEALKPLAVWLLAGDRLTPAEGFWLGGVCGAGFALVESLFSVIGADATSWMTLAVGRIGTTTLHITTAALMGGALAQAWQSRRYERLGLMYLLVVGLHGLWNLLALTSGLARVLEPSQPLRDILSLADRLSPFALLVLALALFWLLAIERTAVNRAGAVMPAPVLNDSVESKES